MLWYISRTTKATAQFDILDDHERAHFSANVGISGMLITYHR